MRTAKRYPSLVGSFCTLPQPALVLTCEWTTRGTPSTSAGVWDPTANDGVYQFALETVVSLGIVLTTRAKLLLYVPSQDSASVIPDLMRS